MNFTKSESIGDLLVQHIPKELILALQEAFLIGSTRAYHGVEHTHPGHVKNVLGQLRHFELNEAFHTVMQSHNLEVSELKGNNIVVAKSGISVERQQTMKNGMQLNEAEPGNCWLIRTCLLSRLFTVIYLRIMSHLWKARYFLLQAFLEAWIICRSNRFRYKLLFVIVK